MPSRYDFAYTTWAVNISLLASRSIPGQFGPTDTSFHSFDSGPMLEGTIPFQLRSQVMGGCKSHLQSSFSLFEIRKKRDKNKLTFAISRCHACFKYRNSLSFLLWAADLGVSRLLSILPRNSSLCKDDFEGASSSFHIGEHEVPTLE